MTNAEAYKEGFQIGHRWAEEDISNHEPVDSIADELKDWYARNQAGVSRARALGVIRGYRRAVDRFEKGTLTREMFDTLPLGT